MPTNYDLFYNSKKDAADISNAYTRMALVGSRSTDLTACKVT